MTSEDLDQLVTAMRANAVSSMIVEAPELTLRLVLPDGSTGPVNAAPPSVPEPARIPVRSPGIGTFSPRGLEDGLEPIAMDRAVINGEILGYVAQGSARHAVIAPVAGTLVGELPGTGRITGYGDILMTLEVRP
ncbi:hypothetical protein [Labrenzia sp. OB1]|uniref:hypothetical protein n=1 Tax=Labrenzia sp. OB1 TaxID=1561204 RepID=UPI000839157F|nr:hypothetical protein [Labrenzia sp. OB1]